MLKMFKGESLTRLIQGACAGSLIAIIAGFNLFGGWYTNGQAKTFANKSAEAAMVKVLAPICVDKFQHTADATATLIKLKATDSWKQDDFVKDGGWATFPGNPEPNRNVAEACAKMLSDLK